MDSCWATVISGKTADYAVWSTEQYWLNAGWKLLYKKPANWGTAHVSACCFLIGFWGVAVADQSANREGTDVQRQWTSQKAEWEVGYEALAWPTFHLCELVWSARYPLNVEIIFTAVIFYIIIFQLFYSVSGLNRLTAFILGITNLLTFFI